VGGRYGSTTLPTALSAAETNGITLMVDGVTETDSIQWYGGGNGDHDNQNQGAYRMEYRSNGYSPEDERLRTIETPILYSFKHDIGSGEYDPDISRWVWKATPPSTGLLLRGYSGGFWQYQGIPYRVTFRLKINDNTGHVLVATVRVIQNGTNLVDQQIYSDNFPTNEKYQEFEYAFTTKTISSGVKGISSSDADYMQLTSMLPEDGAQIETLGDPCALDYQVDYHGNRTLTVDQIIIENRYGDRLFNGQKNSDLLRDVQWAFGQDAGNPTIRGFYADEPTITRIPVIRYMNDLIGSVAPNRIGFRETMRLTINRNYVFHQYLNAGSNQNRDEKLLVDRYPIEYGSPTPGQSGYNTYIQSRWENYLIPFLLDANYVSSYNGKPFWYAVQVHSWTTAHRDPDPKEIRCMVNLGLAYGAKGIFYFLYASIPFYNARGLVDENFNHTTEPYRSKWNEVQQLNKNIQLLAPDLLNLNWQSAFTNGDQVPSESVVQSVTGSDYIEIANFTHRTTGEKYFMLVNRRCETADVKTLTVTLQSSSNWRLIQDVLASRTEWDNDQYRVPYRVLSPQQNTITVKLNPGEGRLFKIITNLSTVSGTISSNTTWSGCIGSP